MDFVKKTEQVYVNTWHGTPLKYIGKRASEDALIVQNMQRDFLMCDYLLSPNPFTTEIITKILMLVELYLTGFRKLAILEMRFFIMKFIEKMKGKNLVLVIKK